MDLYESIFERKSIRKYADKKVDEKSIELIRKFLSELQPLFKDINVKLDVLVSTEMSQYFVNSGSIKSPYYIVITAENKPWFGENVGFMGEQLVAFLTSIGVGTCWLGRLTPKQAAFKLPYVITIAFGYADGNLYRDKTCEINRKSIDEICLKKPQNHFMEEVVQAVRIAPSGINRQPWRIEPDGFTIHFYCEQPSFLTPVNGYNIKGLMPGSILKRMQGIDCGIALAHIQICASHYGKKLDFLRIQECEKAYKKLTYVISGAAKPE